MELKRLLRRAGLRRSLQQVGVALVPIAIDAPMHRPHGHDIIELVVVRSGSLEHEIDGHRFRSGPGRIDLVPPGAAHRYRPRGGTCRIVNLICDPCRCPDHDLPAALAQRVCALLGTAATRGCQLHPPREAGLTAILDAMLREQTGRQPAWAAALDLHYRLLAVSLARCLSEDRVRWSAAGRSPLEDHQLDLLRLAIDDHPQRDWNLARIATGLGVSREQACRRFQRAYGRSPMDYVAQRRLALAQDLLLRGTGVEASALAAGFPSRAALHRSCVRDSGLGPRAWLHSQGG